MIKSLNKKEKEEETEKTVVEKKTVRKRREKKQRTKIQNENGKQKWKLTRRKYGREKEEKRI